MNKMNEILNDVKPLPVCEITTLNSEGVRNVYLSGQLVYSVETADVTNDRNIAVQLYLTHGIKQGSIAKAWGVSTRCIGIWVAAYRDKGVEGLRMKEQGCPVKLTPQVKKRALELRRQRRTITEIARMLKLSPRSVTTIVNETDSTQPDFFEEQTSSVDAEQAELIELESQAVESGIDPLNRTSDRVLAVAGLLEDAEPIFANSMHVEGAGALLAVAVLAKGGFLESTQAVYRTLGPAFYGLRSIFMTFFLMAVLRVKSPEEMRKTHPHKLGRLLGLDRAPAIKTIRRKIKALAGRQQAVNLMNLRSKEMVAGNILLDAVLYVDGHVMCYHGDKKVGKTFSNNKNQVVKGVTDYWVNLKDGTPLLCIPTAFNDRLNKVLPKIVMEAAKSCKGRRITVVFDRGGADASAYEMLIKMGCDFIAYHKNPEKIDASVFKEQEYVINKRTYKYAPHERECEVPVYTTAESGRRSKSGQVVKLREIIIRREDGGFTHVITTRRDLDKGATCGTLFSRWTQENFFKYMIATYNLDHLYTYQAKNVPDDIDHPNPEYTQLTSTKKKIRHKIAVLLGKELDNIAANKLDNLLEIHSRKKGETGKKFKELSDQLKLVNEALAVTAKRETAADYQMLESETRLIGNIVKMAAWDAEGQLANLVRSEWNGVNGNERGIVESFMQTTGSLEVVADKLIIRLQSQFTPKETRLLAHICSALTDYQVCYPGTKTVMAFEVEEPHQCQK